MVEPASRLYVEARKVLLDALGALDGHRSALVVVGAQAVYLRTGPSAIRSAPYTTDADLAVDPRTLGLEPELETAMRAAGFDLIEDTPDRIQPGLWHKWAGTAADPIDVEVDLLVPTAFMPPTTSRGARLAGHSKRAARLTPGLEAALVDHGPLTVTALDAGDTRSSVVEVAGLPALLVAKLHKINDRAQPGIRPDRLTDKDAGDVVRIMLATSPDELVVPLRRLLEHPQAGASTAAALGFLRPLFGAPRAPGVRMATEALVLDMPAARVAEVCTGFARALVAQVGSHERS